MEFVALKYHRTIAHANWGIVSCWTMLHGIIRLMVMSILLFAFSSLAAVAQELTPDTLSVSINFRQGRSTLELGFMDNKRALDRFVKAYNNQPHNSSIIHIIGYASPEGTVAINQRLSRNRAAAIANYLKNNCNISADSIVCLPIGVDWQDLYTAVLADPNVPEREKVLDIITNVSDIVSDSHGVLISQRNKQLQHLEGGRAWNYMLKNIYPYLRGAMAKVVCIVDRPEPKELTTLSELVVPVKEEAADTNYVAPYPIFQNRSFTVHNTELAKRLLHYPIAAVRSNLLLPLLNVGVEVPVSKHWSIGADYYYPWFWPAKENKNCFELIFVSAEARYWFNACTNPLLPNKNYLTGHSVAPYAAWGYYDFERNYHGHQGCFYSAGLDYIYAFPIAKDRLHLELQLAVGAVWSPKAQPYNVYEKGGHLIREKGHHKNFNYVGPTKVGVSLVVPIYRKVKQSSPKLP